MLKINISKNISTSKGIILLKINIDIEKNMLICLFGESGCGKTTLLRILAGLENPDSGEIIYNGKTFFNSKKRINIKPQKRKIGFVFQDFALFDHMTVKNNLKFINNDKKIISNLLEITKLSKMKNRYPSSLSGGQKQRLAVARALARQPEILLLDEPFSSLDEQTKYIIQDEILSTHNNFKLTTLLVTHNLQEAWKMSNKVYLIKNGEISKSGKPKDVFINKNTSNKFSFIGKIIEIKKVDIIYIAMVAVGLNIIEAIITNEEAEKMKIGDKVLIASKAFNPILKKI